MSLKKKSNTVSDNVVEKFTGILRQAANKYKTDPKLVTSVQFWIAAGNAISEWDVRKLGGFTALRDTIFGRSESEVIPRSQKTEFKPKKLYLDNFTTYSDDIKELFKMAKLGPDGRFRVVVLPDLHVPEHDEHALGAILNFVGYYKPHGLIHLGDFLESKGVSHWPSRDSKPKRYIPEIKKGIEILTRLEKAAGAQCFYKRFLEGNHEVWLYDYLSSQAPEFMDGLEDLGINLRVQDLLKLKDFGYRTIPFNEILKIGNMHFIHGYYTGKYAAAKHLEVFGVNVTFGHIHDVQSHSAVTVRGLREALGIGCLRTLNAPFLKGRPNNWAHAFMFIEFDINGDYTRYVPIIIDGKFSFNGKVFSA